MFRCGRRRALHDAACTKTVMSPVIGALYLYELAESHDVGQTGHVPDGPCMIDLCGKEQSRLGICPRGATAGSRVQELFPEEKAWLTHFHSFRTRGWPFADQSVRNGTSPLPCAALSYCLSCGRDLKASLDGREVVCTCAW